MEILDLFSGTGSATQPFKDRGHHVVTVDIDPRFGADVRADIMALSPIDMRATWDFIWASPPCEAFSVAAIGKNWEYDPSTRTSLGPKSRRAREAMEVVTRTLEIIESLEPRYFLIENPRAMLRTMPFISHLPRYTVTYCQYGDTRMKPTDLWGYVPETMRFRPPCKSGDPCHEAASRGSKTGTQGLKDAVERGRVPYELGLDLCIALEGFEVAGSPQQGILL